MHPAGARSAEETRKRSLGAVHTHGREHLLDDVTALQSLDGTHHFQRLLWGALEINRHYRPKAEVAWGARPSLVWPMLTLAGIGELWRITAMWNSAEFTLGRGVDEQDSRRHNSHIVRLMPLEWT